MNSKRCTVCKQTKELQAFGAHTTAKGGKQPACKSCLAKKQAKYRVNAPRTSSDKYTIKRSVLSDMLADSNMFLKRINAVEIKLYN